MNFSTLELLTKRQKQIIHVRYVISVEKKTYTKHLSCFILYEKQGVQ